MTHRRRGGPGGLPRRLSLHLPERLAASAPASPTRPASVPDPGQRPRPPRPAPAPAHCPGRCPRSPRLGVRARALPRPAPALAHCPGRRLPPTQASVSPRTRHLALHESPRESVCGGTLPLGRRGCGGWCPVAVARRLCTNLRVLRWPRAYCPCLLVAAAIRADLGSAGGRVCRDRRWKASVGAHCPCLDVDAAVGVRWRLRVGFARICGFCVGRGHIALASWSSRRFVRGARPVVPAHEAQGRRGVMPWRRMKGPTGTDGEWCPSGRQEVVQWCPGGESNPYGLAARRV